MFTPEILGFLTGSGITLLVTLLNNKTNTQNLKLQLQHQTRFDNKKHKIEKLEEVIQLIIVNRKEIILTSAFDIAKKANENYDTYLKIIDKK